MKGEVEGWLWMHENVRAWEGRQVGETQMCGAWERPRCMGMSMGRQKPGRVSPVMGKRRSVD